MVVDIYGIEQLMNNLLQYSAQQRASGLYVEIEEPLIWLTKAKQTFTTNIISNSAWTLSLPDWLSSESMSGIGNKVVIISATENPYASYREGKIEVVSTTNSSIKDSVIVRQLASNVDIVFDLDPTSHTSPTIGDSFGFKVSSTVYWDGVINNYPKVTIQGINSSTWEGGGNKSYTANVIKNLLAWNREYKITLSTPIVTVADKVLNITSLAAPAYFNLSTSAVTMEWNSGATASITVNTNAKWTANTPPSWLSYATSGTPTTNAEETAVNPTTLTFTILQDNLAPDNGTWANRSHTITYNWGSGTSTVTITQLIEPKAQFTFNSTTIPTAGGNYISDLASADDPTPNSILVRATRSFYLAEVGGSSGEILRNPSGTTSFNAYYGAGNVFPATLDYIKKEFGREVNYLNETRNTSIVAYLTGGYSRGTTITQMAAFAPILNSISEDGSAFPVEKISDNLYRATVNYFPKSSFYFNWTYTANCRLERNSGIVSWINMSDATTETSGYQYKDYQAVPYGHSTTGLTAFTRTKNPDYTITKDNVESIGNRTQNFNIKRFAYNGQLGSVIVSTFQVVQEAEAAAFFDADSIQFASSGGRTGHRIKATGNTQWRITSIPSWLTITSDDASGVGSKDIIIACSPNYVTTDKTATLTLEIYKKEWQATPPEWVSADTIAVTLKGATPTLEILSPSYSNERTQYVVGNHSVGVIQLQFRCNVSFITINNSIFEDGFWLKLSGDTSKTVDSSNAFNTWTITIDVADRIGYWKNDMIYQGGNAYYNRYGSVEIRTTSGNTLGYFNIVQYAEGAIGFVTDDYSDPNNHPPYPEGYPIITTSIQGTIFPGGSSSGSIKAGSLSDDPLYLPVSRAGWVAQGNSFTVDGSIYIVEASLQGGRKDSNGIYVPFWPTADPSDLEEWNDAPAVGVSISPKYVGVNDVSSTVLLVPQSSNDLGPVDKGQIAGNSNASILAIIKGIGDLQGRSYHISVQYQLENTKCLLSIDKPFPEGISVDLLYSQEVPGGGGPLAPADFSTTTITSSAFDIPVEIYSRGNGYVLNIESISVVDIDGVTHGNTDIPQEPGQLPANTTILTNVPVANINGVVYYNNFSIS